MVIAFIVYILYGGRKRIEKLQQELRNNPPEFEICMLGSSCVGVCCVLCNYIFHRTEYYFVQKSYGLVILSVNMQNFHKSTGGTLLNMFSYIDRWTV